jgi:phosphoglycerate kinase
MMAGFRTLDSVRVAGRTVLIRLDLNVPMQDGEVTDRTRIERAVRTLRELSAGGAKIVILSHFGRPKGERQASMSLAPLREHLAKALPGIEVGFVGDCIGDEVEEKIRKLRYGHVLLLENLRFHPGEEKNDPAFADQLAALGDIFVNDAFSCAHRAHASVTGLAERLPSVAGRLARDTVAERAQGPT